MESNNQNLDYKDIDVTKFDPVPREVIGLKLK